LQRSNALVAYEAADGPFGEADAAKDAADRAVVTGDEATGKMTDGSGADVPDTSMWKLRWDAKQTWNAAI
jgi:hypothetical protein